MATSERPEDRRGTVGMDHPTVVPTNFEPEEPRERKRERE
jgi:hypothetical protein